MMPGTEFGAAVDKRGPDTVIELRGDVNRSAQERLAIATAEAQDGPGRLLFDFGKVDYINSTGIALIVGVLAQARSVGRAVGAFGLSDHYREIFQITRLSDFMTIYEGEITASGELGAKA